MKKSVESIGRLKSNNKGYTLIELLIVIAMIVALTSLGTGGFVTLSHARANKAANSLDSLIAQSKVNALSGQENYLIVRYDDEADCYVPGLHSVTKDQVTGSETISDTPYDSVELGNDLLTIEMEVYSGSSLTRKAVTGKGESNKSGIIMRFNEKTGKLDKCYLSYNGAEESTASVVKIYVSFGSSHIIEIYKLTGEHHIVGQDT